MDDSLRGLRREATVDDFVPSLAHRFTRERLKALGRAHGPEDAQSDVLFIGLGDTGRGQMAAALLTLPRGRRGDGRARRRRGAVAGVAVLAHARARDRELAVGDTRNG
jgi:hypothetical protein